MSNKVKITSEQIENLAAIIGGDVDYAYCGRGSYGKPWIAIRNFESTLLEIGAVIFEEFNEESAELYGTLVRQYEVDTMGYDGEIIYWRNLECEDAPDFD